MRAHLTTATYLGAVALYSAIADKTIYYRAGSVLDGRSGTTETQPARKPTNTVFPFSPGMTLHRGDELVFQSVAPVIRDAPRAKSESLSSVFQNMPAHRSANGIVKLFAHLAVTGLFTYRRLKLLNDFFSAVFLCAMEDLTNAANQGVTIGV